MEKMMLKLYGFGGRHLSYYSVCRGRRISDYLVSLVYGAISRATHTHTQTHITFDV